jgi:hypothetical protein
MMLLLLYPPWQQPFGKSMSTHFIHTSWMTLMCLGLVQFLQLVVACGGTQKQLTSWCEWQ